jgi:cytochrome P450
VRTIKQGRDDYGAERDKIRASAVGLAIAGTETASSSATALALLALETQFARIADTLGEFLQMAKDDQVG